MPRFVEIMRWQGLMLVAAGMLCGVAVPSWAADRYWVGGAGTWSDAGHWSVSSGGVGGASVPAASDDARFDSGSGIGTVALDANATVRDLELASSTSAALVLSMGSFRLTCTRDCLFMSGGLAQGQPRISRLIVGRNLDTAAADLSGQSYSLSIELTGTGYWRYSLSGPPQPKIWELSAAAVGQTTTLRPVGSVPIGVDIDIQNQLLLGDASSTLRMDLAEAVNPQRLTIEIHSADSALDVVSSGAHVEIDSIEHEMDGAGQGTIQTNIDYDLGFFDITGAYGASAGFGPSWHLAGPLDLGSAWLLIEKTAELHTDGHDLSAALIVVGNGSDGTGELHVGDANVTATQSLRVGGGRGRPGRLYVDDGRVASPDLDVEGGGESFLTGGNGTIALTGQIATTGTVYYVSADGNDSASGLSASMPFRSFDRAISELRSGSTVLFQRGDSWDLGSSALIHAAGGQIGAYGSGDAPILELVSGGRVDVDGEWRMAGLEMQFGAGTVVVGEPPAEEPPALEVPPAIGAAPIVTITSPRSSCVAPCAIFFDARATSDADLQAWQAFVDLNYSWDFGDPDSGSWGEGARATTSDRLSRNMDTGFVAGHVYENPGTYRATLDVSDGTNISTRTFDVTISSPETVWSGSNTVCIANGSTPIAGSNGCPAGAVVMNSGDFDLAIRTHDCDDLARRCLFRRGDAFAAESEVSMTTSGPTLIGAYGSGPKPLINTADAVDTFSFDPGNADIRIVDLEIVGADGDGRNGGSALAISSERGTPIYRLLALRLDISHFDHQIHFRGPSNDFTPGVNMPREIAVVDSTVLDGPGNGGNDVFVMWEDSLFMGNRVGDKFDGANGLGEHILRAKFSHGVVYSHNSMGLMNDSGGRIGCGSIRHVIKMVSGFAIPYPVAGVSREYIVADNFFSACKDNSIDVDIGRTDSRLEKVNEGQRNYIVERNLFTKRFTLGGTLSLQVEGEGGVVRNNVFDLSGPGDGTARGMRVWNRAPVTNPPVPTENMRVYNNTCYAGYGTTSGGLCIEVRSHSRNAIVRNNLLYENVATGVTLLMDSGVGTVTCVNCNVGVTSSPFAVSNPSVITDFALSEGASIVDAGLSVPAMSAGYPEGRVPLDGDSDGIAQLDLGAFELFGEGGNQASPLAAPFLLP
ncbi:MAG: hypothetical protein CL933_24030 [Deltaproteobacteria bacterium]|nr:hypothetical protein [Deltaproteobacteria bacterium]